MIEVYDEVTICTAYLSALINGDYSGLTDEDEALLDEWCETLPDYAFFDVSMDEPEFTRDCVSGLMGDCVDMKILVNKET
jgi:hypothetical protein